MCSLDARFYDTRTGHLVAEVNEPSPTSFAFSPDGKTVAVKDCDGRIALLSVPSFEITQWIVDDVTDGPDIEYSACGQFLVTGWIKQGVTVRDAATGEVTFFHPVPDTLTNAVARSADGKVWITAHDRKASDETFFLRWEWPFDAATMCVLPYRVRHKNMMALSPDGDLLAVGFDDGDTILQVYSISRRTILHSQPGSNGPNPFLDWSPCGRYLSWSMCYDVRVLDFERRTTCATYRQRYPDRASFSPDGTRIAISGEGGYIAPFSPGAPRPRTRRARTR